MITIFTPTYNRAYLLPQLYKSIVNQSDCDFEWIIIDDGSVDDTEDIVNRFKNSHNRFTIRYYKRINGGKHRAINDAVKIARGKWFFIVDSDDILPIDSIKIIKEHIGNVEDRIDIAGVCGLRQHIKTENIIAISDRFKEIIDLSYIDFRYTTKISGDMAEVYRTDILRKYPFPTFEGEKFISEGVVWNRISQKYKLRYFPIPIYRCEYIADGLTRSIRQHYRKSPKGAMLYYNEFISNPRIKLMDKIRGAINYWRYSLNYPLKERESDLKPIWWTVFFIPIALLFYIYDGRNI